MQLGEVGNSGIDNVDHLTAIANRLRPPPSAPMAHPRHDEEDGRAWNPTTYHGGDPHEAWYRFNGKQIGDTGNDSPL